MKRNINQLILYNLSKMGQEKKSSIKNKVENYKFIIFCIVLFTLFLSFASSFNVHSTPLENFDINETTGQIRYRPIDQSWLDIPTASSRISSHASTVFDFDKTYSYSIWINITAGVLSNDGSFVDVSQSNKYIKVIDGKANILNRNISSVNHNISSNTYINDSKWHHIVFVINETNGNMSIYIDGLLEGSLTAGPPEAHTASSYFISSVSSGGDLVGDIDEHRLYNRILSETEILQINNSGRRYNSSLSTTSLLAHLNFNHINATTYKDLSSNKRDYTRGVKDSLENNGINLTDLGYIVNVSITNQSQALVFWNNYSLINNDVTGDTNYSFYYNQTMYILDSFNLSENVNRSNSPLWFSQTQNLIKHIASNLSSSIYVNVIVNTTLNCGQIKMFKYTTHSGTITRLFGNEAIAACGNATTTGYLLYVEPAQSSNILELSLVGETELQCLEVMDGYQTVGTLLGLVVLVLVFATIGGMMYFTPNVVEDAMNDLTGYIVSFIFIGVVYATGLLIMPELCAG